MTHSRDYEGRSQTDGVVNAAEGILQCFDRYNEAFRGVTRKARGRFERREWAGLQDDINERYALYETWVQTARQTAEQALDPHARDRVLWRLTRNHYRRLIRGHPDVEFVKTFFNSVSRRALSTVGIDEDVEFVAMDLDPTKRISACPDLQVWPVQGTLEATVADVIGAVEFNLPDRDRDAGARCVADGLRAAAERRGLRREFESLEVLAQVFYQSTRAYRVGRALQDGVALPMVVALANDGAGVYVDAVLTRESEISVLFGFTRSYFMADLEAVTATVVYLKRMLTRKPLAELFTVLGRVKQGKTELYRALEHHLERSSDRFCHAPGTPGMVMIAFTLPSADTLFKVIRDQFDYPKSVDRADVLDRYKLVFQHDRGGRLIDAQEFRRLEFERRRFDPALLEELRQAAASTVTLTDDKVVIDHLYTERRLTPLNLYLQSCTSTEAEHVVIDYGQALRDLARSNIFPGDLLLKNFGVTRRRRVIFYDYDELCLLTDCHFRHLPEPRSQEELLADETWFHVAENDVFPEQFHRFMGLPPELMAVFREHHGELFTVEYWSRIQRRIRQGEVLEILPYRNAPPD